MSINKFGASLGIPNTLHYQCNGILRTYVRDNALCLTASGFDARSCKIRRVAQPESDTDAANKRYVETSVKLVTDRLEDIEKKIATLDATVQKMMGEVEGMQGLVYAEYE